MSEHVQRAYVARVTDVDPKRRTVVGKINTAALDRYKTVIDPRGIDRTKYTENPVVMFEHGLCPSRGAMPVGRNNWIRPAIGPSGPELIAETAFYTKERKGDEFTERLFECYQDGDMRAFSVRVIPTGNCSPPTPQEIRDRPELAECEMMYRSSELAEYSCVSVPGNAECLSVHDARSILRCVARGLTLPDDLVSQARVAAVEYISRYIVHDGTKWHVLDDDMKIVGEWNTREEAEAHRQRLEASNNTTVAHGGGGDDDTSTSVAASAPAAEPTLPPLVGRSFDDVRREYAAQIRQLVDFDAIKRDVQDRIRLTKGKV